MNGRVEYLVTCKNRYLKDLYPAERFDGSGAAAAYITDHTIDIADYYNDMLDDCYGEVEICGLEYSASIALQRVDTVAYNCGLNDFIDSIQQDIINEIVEAAPGATIDFYDFSITVIAVDG